MGERDDIIETAINGMMADDPTLDPDQLRRAFRASVSAGPPVRLRGRPAGEPSVDVHLLLPVLMLEQIDAQRGDVPRLVFIRRILAEWLENNDAR